MASLMAPVKDGKLVGQTVEEATDSTSTRKVSNTMDKEAFLQLLVAQMQYQDPLEPTSNTEYVAQLATFSELEAMTNLNESMAISRASELIGKKVTVQKVSATTGDITATAGNVDYVIVENNKAYLVIDDEPYSIDDLTSVMTEEYWKKYQDTLDKESVTAQTIMAAIATLPKDVKDLTLKDHAELVKAIRKTYNELSTEEQRQVSDEALVKLIKAETQIAKLEAEEKRDEEDKKDPDDSSDDKTEEGSGDKTEGTPKA
ncbi:MAG: hypothetical protein HFI75_10275 [Lachnospiraceae bacterium]|nr:hypothetical protein [Lachnospiraceae bacterium]